MLMTEERREIDLREIIISYTKETEPDIELTGKTLAEAMEEHENLFRTHYTFTDRDFDLMVIDLMNYIKHDSK